MGEGSKRGRDLVLESRHLVGMFLVFVVVCGVFFWLGYVLGSTQPETTVRAASAPVEQPAALPAAEPSQSSAQPEEKPVAGVPQPSDWNFYRAGEPAKPSEERLDPVKPAETRRTETKPASRAATPPAPDAAYRPPQVTRGAVVLQVAALTSEKDALSLAQNLQHKEFPAFVLSPQGDRFYRVQVGPYADLESAQLARRALEKEGFKSIVRR
jgi:septal ring-binding cell division protein DamX